MTDLDKLARDLAWIDHRHHCPGAGRAKHRHWQGMTEVAREGWRQLARRFCFFLHRLNDDALNDAHILGDFGTGA